MSARGFTLVELLVATVITLLVVGAALTVTTSARASFDAGPGALDTTRRLREGAEVLVGALHSAGGDVGSGALLSSVPVVWPLTSLDGSTSGPRFEALFVLRAIDHAAGRLAVPQPGPADSLTLAPLSSCPAVPGVCGLTPDDVAIVFDARGRFDIFEVGAVVPALMRVTPAAPLARAYGAGAYVARARADRLGLVEQPDGSHVLSRVTWAGAREPVVDGVVGLDLRVWGEALPPELVDGDDGSGLATYGLAPPPIAEEDSDGFWPQGEHCMVSRADGVPESRLTPRGAAGELTELHPADLDDGPWCANDVAMAAFDADLFRVRRIDVRLRVEAPSAMLRGPAGRLFSRAGTAAMTPLAWVPDREIAVSIAVPRR